LGCWIVDKVRSSQPPLHNLNGIVPIIFVGHVGPERQHPVKCPQVCNIDRLEESRFKFPLGFAGLRAENTAHPRESLIVKLTIRNLVPDRELPYVFR